MVYLAIQFNMTNWQKYDAYDNECVKKAAMLVLGRDLESLKKGTFINICQTRNNKVI